MGAKQGKGSKTKGNGFERKIAKRLTKWFADNGLEIEFNRVPASGGLRWSKQYTNVIGDIVCPESFRNTIECKNREDWNHKSFIEIGEPCKSGLYSWWEQACDEADRAGKLPWLILKKNYCKELLIFSTVDTWSSFSSVLLNKHLRTYIPTFKNYGYGWNFVNLLPLEAFLSVASPKVFLEPAKE